jgi:RNA polymerase sigma-70 factor (ECF subfamily)
MGVVPAASPLPDLESREWLRDLRAGGAAGDEALARLHALLVRAAGFEVTRRRPPEQREAGDLAQEAADDALASVCARLEEFRGDSRFTTWARKFAVREAAVKRRRLAWQGRELPTEPVATTLLADIGLEPAAGPGQPDLVATLRREIELLPPHQRQILLALTAGGVPIDVLAERLGATRGELYSTLRDARAELRRKVGASGSSTG